MQVTMTAVLRPSVLRQTLESFSANLQGADFPNSILFLNIDPAGTGTVAEMLRVAEDYFGHVRYNAPEKPCFAAAVKWCWRQPTDECFLHMEDDWELLRPVTVAGMRDAIISDPTLSVCNLRAYPYDDDRMCLAPGLWRTSHARAIADRMVDHANPEQQLRKAHEKNPHGGAHEGYRGMQFPAMKARVLRDIGCDWLTRSGWRKDNGRHFNAWEKSA